jgi:hypothetical protein
VLGEPAVLDADDVSGNPGRGAAVAGEATVGDDEIALGHDQLVFVAQRCRRRSDQVEQALAAWPDMSAVLNVARGPEPLGGGIVALILNRVSKASRTRTLFCSGVVLVMSVSRSECIGRPAGASSCHRSGRDLVARERAQLAATSSSTLPPRCTWATASLMADKG